MPGPPDFGLFESYAISRHDLAPVLSDAFARAGMTFAVYTASDVAADHYRAAGIDTYHIHHDLPTERGPLPQGTFPLTVGGFTFPDLDTFVDSEALYFFSPRWQLPLVRARGRRYLASASAWADAGVLPRRAMLFHVGAETVRLAMHHACEVAGIPAVYFGAFPGQVRTHMHLHDDLWNTIHPRPQPLPESTVDALIDALLVKEQRDPISYVAGPTGENKARRLMFALRNGDAQRIVWPLNRLTYTATRLAYRSRVERSLAAEAIPDPPFVFVPLHIINDAQTSLRNREWLVQADFVRHVSASVPEGVTVAVKLHPGSTGLIPAPEIREIAALPNTVLVSRHVPPLPLVDRAVASVIINSSAGFEGILRNTPTIVVGNWNYPETPHSVRATSVEEIRAAVLAALEWDRPPGDVRASLAAGLRDMFPGSAYAASLDGDAIVASVGTFLAERTAARERRGG